MKNLTSAFLLVLVFAVSALAALTPAIEVRSLNTPATTVEVGDEVYFSASGTTYDDSVLLGKARYDGRWNWKHRSIRL
jgi:hypothetical protein